MSGDGTYAPKSPDLSSFYSAGPTPPAEPELERASAPQQQHFLSPQSQPDFSHHLQNPPSSSSYQQQPHAPQSQLGQHRHQHPSYQRDTPPQPLAPAAAATRPTHDPSQPPGFSVGVGYSPATNSSTQHEYYPPRAQSFPQPGPGYPVAQASPHQQQQQQQQDQPQPAFHQPACRGSGSFQYQYQLSAGHAAQFPAETAHLYAAQAQVHHQPPYDYPPQAVSAAAEDEGYGGPPGPHLTTASTFPLLDQQPHQQQMPPRRAAAAAAAAAVAAQAAASSGDSGPETQLGGVSSPSPPNTTTNTSTTPGASASGSLAAAAAVFEPGPVKTKFPTARIKRIMQADEEVGKVAQQTPIAVGKALELFMVALVSRSAGVARARSSKRVSAAMLRQAVESDEQWDFLGEIVAKVDVGGGGEEKAGGKGGKGGGKVESESEDEGVIMGGGDGSGSGASGAKRKRGAGGGRKKKVQ